MSNSLLIDEPDNVPDLESLPNQLALEYLFQFLDCLLKLHSKVAAATPAIDHNSSNNDHIRLSETRSDQVDTEDVSPLVMSTPASPMPSPNLDNDMPPVVNSTKMSSNSATKRRMSSVLLSEASAVAALVNEACKRAKTLRSYNESAIIDDDDEHQTLSKKSKNNQIKSKDNPITSSEDTSSITCSEDTSSIKNGTNISPKDTKLAIARRFCAKTVPDISIQAYLERLHKYCPMSTSVYLAAIVYIYRLCIVLQMIPLTSFSAYRLVLACLRIACKVVEDKIHAQKRFAMVGGVTQLDLYRLEISLLFLLEFDVAISPNVLHDALEIAAELRIQKNKS